jgi:hypothetical protein
MQTNCCGHHSTEIELLSVPHTAVVLRVPVRRCALAERMIAILSRTDDGREIAGKIQIGVSGSTDDQFNNDAAATVRAAFGPDLEPISRADCTTNRCRESCTPGYRQMLQHFGYTDEAGEETGEGCLEVSTDTAGAAV